MKIYFLGTFSKLDEYEDNYRQIVEVLESKGHKVLSDHILMDKAKIKELDKSDQRAYFRKMQSRIKSADVMVAEVSFPTASIGYEIAYALENEKPVLVLRQMDNSQKLGAIFEGNTSEKFIVREYSLDNLEQIITKNIGIMKEMLDVRYNFFITREIVHYLNHVAKTKRIPRSVYIRNLIEHEIDDDEVYQKHLSEEYSRDLL